MTAVAKRVREHGKAFEQLLIEKEKANPKFAFLRDEEVCLHSHSRPSQADRASYQSTTCTSTPSIRRTASPNLLSYLSMTRATPRAIHPTLPRILNGNGQPKAKSVD